MATSVVAGGKLRLAAKKGGEIPDTWALDRHGKPTTDPVEAIQHGFMQWAGGYKGFGLATVVEVLGGVLSGGLFGTDVPPMKDFGRDPLVTSAFYLAIDPERFMPIEEFRARVDRLVDHVKASEVDAGAEFLDRHEALGIDRKSTRLNSSHANISYADFCFNK